MNVPPDVQTLIDALLKGLQGLALVFVIALVRHYIAQMKDERLRALVEALVGWAEQVFPPEEARQKRAAVADVLREARRPVDDTLIEAAVNKLPPTH